jgi:pantoate--beta-alanine ligase
LVQSVRATVATQPRVELEYVEARDAHALIPVDTLAGDVLLALAARVGGTRLIDNVMFSSEGTDIVADLGTRSKEEICNAR